MKSQSDKGKMMLLCFFASLGVYLEYNMIFVISREKKKAARGNGDLMRNPCTQTTAGKGQQETKGKQGATWAYVCPYCQ